MTIRQSELLEWYDFTQAEWTHVGRGALDFGIGTLAPVGGFYLLYRALNFQLAVFTVFGWAAAVFIWHVWRIRRVEVFSLTTMVLAGVKATAGLVSGDVRLYLLWPSLENIFYAIVFFGSAQLGRPLLAVYAQRLYPIPDGVRCSVAFRRAFFGASVAWAAVSVVRAGLRVVLVSHLSFGTFLVVDSVIGWPMYAALLWFTAWFPLRTLRQAGLVLP